MQGVKGVVLAGGLGARLHPLTHITNKHLLPVYKKPMIFYPIQKLAQAGLKDIAVVVGGQHSGDFLRLLRDGHDFGLNQIHYTYQHGEGGIAEALGLTRTFVGKDKVCVVLGDNIFEDDIGPSLRKFMAQPKGARVFLKAIPDPQRFGCPVLDGDKVVRIEEKPQVPKSPFAVTGIYMYDNAVFDIIENLVPSDRNELEITDVSNEYIKRGTLSYEILKGWWTDAGTFDSLLRAAMRAAGLKVI